MNMNHESSFSVFNIVTINCTTINHTIDKMHGKRSSGCGGIWRSKGKVFLNHVSFKLYTPFSRGFKNWIKEVTPPPPTHQTIQTIKTSNKFVKIITKILKRQQTYKINLFFKWTYLLTWLKNNSVVVAYKIIVL